MYEIATAPPKPQSGRAAQHSCYCPGGGGDKATVFKNNSKFTCILCGAHISLSPSPDGGRTLVHGCPTFHLSPVNITNTNGW